VASTPQHLWRYQLNQKKNRDEADKMNRGTDSRDKNVVGIGGRAKVTT